jgi:hypothetical protein
VLRGHSASATFTPSAYCCAFTHAEMAAPTASVRVCRYSESSRSAGDVCRSGEVRIADTAICQSRPYSAVFTRLRTRAKQ